MAYMPFDTSPGKSTTPGRPAWIRNLVVLKQPDNAAGFEMAKSGDPEVMAAAKQQYMTAGATMPNALMSRRVSPTGAIEQRRRRAISKGWRNPRGVT